MAYYLRQFVKYIVDNKLSKELILFFNTRKDLYAFDEQDLYSLVSNTLDEYFEGNKLPEELHEVIRKTKKKASMKRIRWHESYMKDIENLDRDDPHHPFYNKINYMKSLPPEQYVEIFGTKTPEEILAAEVEQVESWRRKGIGFLISFPGLHLYTTKNVYNTFKIDIIINIWEYIDKELGGNISSFEKIYPEVLLDKPLFSPSSFSLMMDEASSDLFRESITDEEGRELLELEVALSGKNTNNLSLLKSLDEDALSVMEIFIANVGKSFINTRTVQVDVNTIAKGLVDYNPGVNVIDKVEKICDRLVAHHHKFTNDKTIIFFNFFDNIVINREAEHPYAIATFGEVLAEAIIRRSLISITQNEHALLQDELSRIICYALKKEQIANQQTRKGDYSYTYFQKIVRFPKRNKANNIAAIKASLQEFVNNQIIVESFVYENNKFIITFLPLNSYELEDLSLCID